MELRTDKICCPYCAVLIASKSITCIHCGKELHFGLYQVVPDGVGEFGIAFEGTIKVHGLTLERAERISEILNQQFSR